MMSRLNMRNTTLCYLERDGRYLMLHRTVKENDLNKDKWIGIGGKFEEGESPEDCLRREVFEETGLTLDSWRYCGIVTFVSDGWGTEYMHLFHTGAFHGTLRRLMDDRVPFFSLKLRYEGDRLTEAVLNGKQISTGNMQ